MRAASIGGAVALDEVIEHDGGGCARDPVEERGRAMFEVREEILSQVAQRIEHLEPRLRVAIAHVVVRAVDDRVAGVLLRPRGAGMGRAYAQEIRMHVEALRAAGKQVACHLETASGNELYACAGVNTRLIDPVGSVRLLGTGATVVLYGETVRKLGVRADFLRIGHHKSAAEQLPHRRMSAFSIPS